MGRRGFVPSVLVGMALLAVPMPPSLAQVPTVYDDFNDNITNPFRWSYEVAESVRLSEANQRLEVTILPDQSTGFRGGNYMSSCRLRGDFDIQVDYQLLSWPDGNGVRTALVAGDPESHFVFVERTSNKYGPRESYIFCAGATHGCILTPTDDLSGQLRLVRQGGLYSGYYMGPNGWVLIASSTDGPGTQDLEFHLNAWADAPPEEPVMAVRDNMVINSGTLVCPVQEVDIALNLDRDGGKLNPKRQHLPLWILGTESFDATEADPSSIRFGNLGAEDTPPSQWALEDADDDGDLDLKLQFSNDSINCQSVAAAISGTTWSETPLGGFEPVTLIGCASACTAPPEGMLSWWRGDDGRDSAGQNDGVLYGDTTSEPGIVGGAFAFDGDGDYVEATDIDLPLGAAPRTLELWINPAYNARLPFIYGGFEGNDGYYAIVMDATVCVGQWGGEPPEPCGTTDVTDGAWHHVALTYDGTFARLYVDGALEVAQKKFYATTSLGVAYIGSTVSNSEEYFPGLVDEVTIYNRALKPAEIRSIVASGSFGKCVTEP